MSRVLRYLILVFRSPTVFTVVVFVSYFLGSMLPQVAVDRGTVEFVAIVATVGGLALGRSWPRRVLVIIPCIVICVGAALGYVLLSGSDLMTNGWPQYALLTVLLAVAFACFGLLIHYSGLEIGEPPGAA